MNILTSSAAWKALEAHRQSLSPLHLRQLFARDPGRVASLSLSFDGILFDFSKQRIDSTTLPLLAALAREARLDEATARMFGGEKINASEDRSVLHVALRRSSGPFPGADLDVMPRFSPRASEWPLLPTVSAPGRRLVSPASRSVMSSISASAALTSARKMLGLRLAFGLASGT
jgi:hypothetical protein